MKGLGAWLSTGEEQLDRLFLVCVVVRVCVYRSALCDHCVPHVLRPLLCVHGTPRSRPRTPTTTTPTTLAATTTTTTTTT